MKGTAHFSSEEKSKPVLIVDKLGILGKALAKELSEDVLTVFVSGNRNTEGLNPQNTIFIPYLNKLPNIPNNIYSHIILINHSDQPINKLTDSFIKKSLKDKSSISYITSRINFSQNSDLERIGNNDKARVVVYGDIFGNDSGENFDNLVTKSLDQVVRNGSLKIPGDGLRKIFPVLFIESITGIFSAVFEERNSKLYFLFPKHPETLMSLSRAVQKLDPSITVDFTKEKIKEESEITSSGEYLLDENIKILDKLRQVDFNKKNEVKSEILSQKIENKKPKLKIKLPFVFLFFLYLLLLPSFFSLFFLGLGFLQMQNLSQEVGSGNLSESLRKASYAKSFLNLSLGGGRIAAFQASLIGLSGVANNYESRIKEYASFLDVGEDVLRSASLVTEVLSGKSSNPSDDVLAALASYKKSLKALEELEVGSIKDENILRKKAEYDSIINSASRIGDSIYPLINPSGKRKYLVLFQNNMELRPGGGFIGSYGLLSLDRGKISDFSVHDVYEADGQLKGHIEPPFPIRRYIPIVHLYLRDSNFDIEFTKSASSSAFLFFQETGQKVDGVIGVDISFVKSLIGAVGEINVPEYNEKINEDNFYFITQSHVEKDFFPSSTQKKDFLSALYKALNNKIAQDKNLSYDKIALAISNAIFEKHILFAFSDPRTQEIFSANNWSSVIKEDLKSDSNTISDFFGINEANIGVNKANFFVSRSIKHEARIEDDGSVVSKSIINFKNDSDKWPGGDYKAYLRIIVPQEATISSVEIDGVTQNLAPAVTNPLLYESRTFSPPSGLEIERYVQSEKNVYGLIAIVPSGKSKEISVTFNHQRKLNTSAAQLTYSLDFFKQPGTEKYPLNFSLVYPDNFSLLNPSKDYILQNGRAALSKVISGDESILVYLSRK